MLCLPRWLAAFAPPPPRLAPDTAVGLLGRGCALGDGRFASRNVVAGAEGGDRIAIREGLQEGDRVVVAAQFLLDSEANLDAGLDRLDDRPAEPASTAQPGPNVGP